MTNYETKVHLAGIALKLSELRTAEDGTQDGVISPLLSTKNSAESAKGTSASTLAGTPTTDKE